MVVSPVEKLQNGRGTHTVHVGDKRIVSVMDRCAGQIKETIRGNSSNLFSWSLGGSV